MKSRKSRRAEADKALRDAIKAHTKDGLVRLYPSEPIGEATLPNYPAVPQDVTPEEAEKLLSFRPAPFSLYESGNQPKEHSDLDALDMEQAWGVSDPSDVEDEAPIQSFPSTPPAEGEQKPKES